MDEHKDTSHDHGADHDHDSPISSSAVALAQRLVISTLKHTGHPKAKRFAEYISKGPEILGKKLGPQIGKLFGSVAKGEPIKPEDEAALLKTMEEHPQETAAILGLLTADLLAGEANAADERQAVLNFYSSSLALICASMASRTTSLALRGFFHDTNCISYWHFERQNLQFSSGKDYLFPNGLDVYFLELEPTDEQLVTLNLEIRNDAKRHLKPERYDVNTNPAVSKLVSIHETTLEFKRVDKDAAKKTEKRAAEAFGIGLLDDDSALVEWTSPIPLATEPLTAMLESVPLALAAQDFRINKLKELKQRMAEESLPKTTPD